MTTPIRKTIKSAKKLPSEEFIISHVSKNTHLVLQFPESEALATADINRIVNSIKSILPENYSVFYAGGCKDYTNITIKRVISASEIDLIAEEIRLYAIAFKASATKLAKSIAALNEVPLSDLYLESENITLFPENWDCYIHGQHYQCENLITKQIVEFSCWYDTNFGVLDPYFFYKFIESTPEMTVPSVINDSFHDMSRVMEHMLKKGKLIKVSSSISSSVGVFATQ